MRDVSYKVIPAILTACVFECLCLCLLGVRVLLVHRLYILRLSAALPKHGVDDIATEIEKRTAASTELRVKSEEGSIPLALNFLDLS